MFLSNKKKLQFVLFSSMLVFSVSGCTVPPRPVIRPQVDKTAEKTQEFDLKQCQQELESLNRVDSKSFKEMKGSFDKLMSTAAQYSEIRKNVSQQMQGTVDAMYKYKIEKLCSEVSTTLLKSTLAQGEGV